MNDDYRNYIEICKCVNSDMDKLAKTLNRLEKIINTNKEKYGDDFIKFANENEEIDELEERVMRNQEIISEWV